MIQQFELTLPSYSRGFHLITNIILTKTGKLPETGLMNIFIKHTSAGLTINENADPTVRADFETIMNKLVPENVDYKHNDEGPDDMPSHVKSTLCGSSITIPISDHKPNLGIWQGIYLCEFRNQPHKRDLLITIYY